MKRVKQNVKNIVDLCTVLFHITPELAIEIILLLTVNAALPFVNILAAQRIVDEFIRFADIYRLTVIAAAAMTANGILLLGIGFLTKMTKTAGVKLELRFRELLSFRQADMAFQDIDSNKVKGMRRNLEQMEMRNGGIETVIDRLEKILKNIILLVLASISFYHVFHMQVITVQSSFWTGYWPLLIFLFFTVCFVAASFVFQARQNLKIAELNRQANSANGGAFSYMQLISDYHFGKDIRIYHLKAYLCRSFQNLWSSSIGYRLTAKLGKEKAIIPCITSVCQTFIDMCIYFLAIMKAVAGEITVGSLVLYISGIQIFTQSVMGLVNAVGEMIGYGELAAAYLDLLRVPKEASEPEDDVPKAPYTLVFDHVFFRYPDTENWVLEDVSLTVPSGRRIALVGENGSGKSTIVKLICRLYEPQKGCIKLNGKDIQKLDLFTYRSLVSTVFQDFSIPSLKLAECIACSEDFSRPAVFKSLNKAGIANESANESETYLFKNFSGDGKEFSGGELQKTAIARAVYKDSPVMIFDEPTAALDPRAEAEIYENLDRIAEDRTVIFISHRLSSCCFCHEIFTLHGGRLVQKGTHEQLVSQPGKYKELWEAQAQFYGIAHTDM